MSSFSYSRQGVNFERSISSCKLCVQTPGFVALTSLSSILSGALSPNCSIYGIGTRSCGIKLSLSINELSNISSAFAIGMSKVQQISSSKKGSIIDSQSS